MMPTPNRATVKSIDLIELREASLERKMPFATNVFVSTLTYWQPQWSVDPSTNRWQLGSNLYPYLIYSGYSGDAEITEYCTNIYQEGEEYAWFQSDIGLPPIPTTKNLYTELSLWEADLVITGRTMYNGIEYPAYVFDVHPKGVGIMAEKAILDEVDTNLYTCIPLYLDHEAAVNGLFTNQSTNLPYLTRSSVWERLNLPHSWTNVNQTVATSNTIWYYTNSSSNVTSFFGTNAYWVNSTNITDEYRFTTGPAITTNMLFERYNVAKYLRWTRGAVLWTNGVATNWIQGTNVNEAKDAALSYPFYDPPEPEPPESDLPEWWVVGLQDGPPGSWFTPTETETLDDGKNGIANNLSSIGSSYKKPTKLFYSTGRYKKEQHYDYVLDYGFPSYANYYFYDWTTISYKNSSTFYDWKPYVNLPCNIDSVSVTGDVYIGYSGDVAGSSQTNIYRQKYGSYDMTKTNKDVWIGDLISVTNDIFAATNIPLSFISLQSSSDWRHWVKYGCLNYGDQDFSLGLKSAQHEGRDVVLKWTFKHCPAE